MKRADTVRWIHRRLLDSFGPQGWWPVTPSGAAGPVYSLRWTRAGLRPAQRFEMALGAILTQNTAWSNVEKALAALRQAGAMDPAALLRLPRTKLEGLIRPSGYFRQKAARLQGFCRRLTDQWRGRLDNLLRLPAAAAREALLAFHGVGPETADSILLYAGRHPFFVVDAYTRRVGERFGLFRSAGYDEVQRFFMDRLRPDVYTYRECHALIVALAKNHCRATPRCGGCPLRSRCRTGRGKG